MMFVMLGSMEHRIPGYQDIGVQEDIPKEALSLLAEYGERSIGTMEFASAIENVRLKVVSKDQPTPER